jgi:hypothetical protein
MSFTPENYELYLKGLSNDDFNQEFANVSQDWVNNQNEMNTLQENPDSNADRIQELQAELNILQQKQTLLNKQQSLRDLADLYRRSNLSTVEGAFAATQVAIDAIISRNTGVTTYPIEDMTALAQEQALLEILQAELNRRKN